MNKVVLIVLVLILPHFSLAQTNCTPKHWINNILLDNPSLSLGQGVLNKYDFSKIWLDDRTCFIGYIGNQFQKLGITFISISKKFPTEYSVEGQSLVNFNRCDFKGVIRITEVRKLHKINKGIDNLWDGKVDMNGIIIADYQLLEDSTQYGSGIFSGALISKWYITPNKELEYDDINSDSDDYSNNQFSGIWTSYKTKKAKPCAWGQYRIPCSGDLDIGAAEFSVNPKYEKNGWEITDCKIEVPKNDEKREKWLGEYSLSIDYGKLDEFSNILIGYSMKIYRDSCVFEGMGYKTYFTDLCSAKFFNKKVDIFYEKTIDGDGFTDHSKIDIVATIVENAGEFFIQSPIIADENWNYNVIIPLKKVVKTQIPIK